MTTPATIKHIPMIDNVSVAGAASMSLDKVSSNKSPVATERPATFNIAINGFRGVCVLLVFAYHVFHSGLLPDSAARSLLGSAATFFASSWRYGVELFFMISGYVIVKSLRRHRNVATFLCDRCIRIFPVWIPMLIGLFVTGAITGWKVFHNLDASSMPLLFIANLLLLPPLVPLPAIHPASWSLSYEWLFYLLSAAAFTLSCRYQLTWNKKMPLWFIWGGITIFTLCLIPRAIFFLPGVIIAMGWVPLEKWHKLLRWPVFSLVIFLLSWRVVDMDQATPGAYSIAVLLSSTRVLFALLALLAGLHLFACICQDKRKVHWLHQPAIQFLGTISYSFYLWHPIVMFAVKRAVVKWIVPHVGAITATTTFAIASFMIALPLSLLSYQLLEQRIGKALRKRVDQPKPIAQLQNEQGAIALAARAEGG